MDNRMAATGYQYTPVSQEAISRDGDNDYFGPCGMGRVACFGLGGSRTCCADSQKEAGQGSWYYVSSGNNEFELARGYRYAGEGTSPSDSQKPPLRRIVGCYWGPWARLWGLLTFLVLVVAMVALCDVLGVANWLVGAGNSRSTGSTRMLPDCHDSMDLTPPEVQRCCHEKHLLCTWSPVLKSHSGPLRLPHDLYNCMSREVFSVQKMAWCCERKHLGCTTRLPPHGTLIPLRRSGRGSGDTVAAATSIAVGS